MKAITCFSIILAASMCFGSCNAKPGSKARAASKAAVQSRARSAKAKSQAHSSLVKEINQAEFRKLFVSAKPERPAVVDFYADWCGPCKMIAPHLETLAKEMEGKVDFYRMNTDNNQELARELQVEAIPYLRFITANGEHSSDMGYKELDELRATIKSKFGLE